MVERIHRTLKADFISRCSDASWTHQLPWVILGLRTIPREGLDVSSAEMVYSTVIPWQCQQISPLTQVLRRTSVTFAK